MAQTPPAASPVEGMEAPPHAGAQPASARYSRNERPSMGEFAQGVLADRRLQPLAVAMPNGYWTALGLQGFSDPYRRFRDAKRTAGCGPARPVVWGRQGEPGAYPIMTGNLAGRAGDVLASPLGRNRFEAEVTDRRLRGRRGWKRVE